MSGEDFASQLRQAEDRLRAMGLTGRGAWAALSRHLAERLGVPRELWLDGPDAPVQAGLNAIPLTAELDLFGLAYERFFPEVFKGERGQFFTPRPLVELMADLAELRPGARVLDPTCGSGSFLVVAHSRGADVDGIELDPELVALCRINLKLHGANPRAVRHADLFRDPVDEQWDVILANPPFSVEVGDAEALADSELAAGRKSISSDHLFLEAAWRRLRPGGRLVALLPRSLLANPSTGALRDWLDERFVRRAVVALPEGVFRPFGGAASQACIVALDRRPAELRSWWLAQVEQPGFDPTRRTYRRTEVDELGLLRLALRQPQADGERCLLATGFIERQPSDERGWLPLATDPSCAIAEGVPTVPLQALARLEHRTAHPLDDPNAEWTVVDLGDVDKLTGEVISARVEAGRNLGGAHVGFEEGDLLFGKMRPALNNVVRVRRPRRGLPAQLCGSGEWARLVARKEPWFALLALRSVFVRNQLPATSGQTRPRIRTQDLEFIDVPDPGPAARAAFERVVGEAMDVRHAARLRLDAAQQLYEEFGRGELDAATLLEELGKLEAT
jgi:SAM-dependent methyltransferase